jgi:hypothetical protein
VPEARRIEFLIRINLDHIIIDGHDIYGDGEAGRRNPSIPLPAAPSPWGFLPWTPKNRTITLACPAIREKTFPKCELHHISRPIPKPC